MCKNPSLKNPEYCFKKYHRLLTPADYQRVFDQVDFKQGGKYFSLLSRTNVYPHHRLGMIIGKRNVKLAVERNRIKRIIRENFRHQILANIDGFPKHCDMVFIAKANIQHLSNKELNNELQRQWQKLLLKIKA